MELVTAFLAASALGNVISTHPPVPSLVQFPSSSAITPADLVAFMSYLLPRGLFPHTYTSQVRVAAPVHGQSQWGREG